jgi:Sporulation and spore germination
LIARYQTILFVVLLAASVAMGGVLWHLRERAHQRLLKGEDSAPTRAPAVAPAEQATLLVANDADNSMIEETQSLPLPQDAGSRARVILGKLLDIYAAPDATHEVPGGASSVAQVFLLPAPSLNSGAGVPPLLAGSLGMPCRQPGQPYEPMDEKIRCASEPKSGNLKAAANGPELAVVNFTGSFAAGHPSGLEAEDLTVESICGTLHANLPRVTQVRFLVDGQPRATLAGHADLTRTYLATDAVSTAGAH